MKITIHHLNRDKKKIGIKEIDLTKYTRFGSTGSGMYFQPRKGKGFEVMGEYYFDIYKKDQESNYECVKQKCYTYARIDKNLPDSPKNRKRDNRGRPIHIYEKPQDLYQEYNVDKWWFFDDETWDILIKYLKKNNIKLWTYYNSEWIDD